MSTISVRAFKVLAIPLVAGIVAALVLALGQGGADRALAQGVPPCPVPNPQPFPDAGCDDLKVAATIDLTITNPPLGSVTCDLSGAFRIVRGPVVTKPPDSIDLDLDSINLAGTCQPGNIAVTLSPIAASIGRIDEQSNTVSGTLEFPADSFLEISGDINVLGLQLHTNVPLVLRCKITAYPPLGCPYQSDPGPIELFDDTDKLLGDVDQVKATLVAENVVVGGLSVDLAGDETGLPLETAESSGTSAVMLAGVIAAISAVAITVTGAAWYARRRLTS